MGFSAMLEQLGLIGNAIILVVALIVLDKASDLAITHSVNVASVTGFGKTTMGFLLVAFSTSLPELLVAIFAVIQPENVGVSIGNILGSNVVNICLILGICFIIVALKCPNRMCFFPTMAKEEMGSLHFGLLVASIIPLTLLYIGYASQFMGIVLIGVFAFYLYQLSKIKNVKEEGSLGMERQKLRKYASLAGLGVIGVVISAYFIVESASFLAVSIGIPKIVIGATVIAFGTSVPELATSINAVRKGHLDLALGNIVGSCFINITCILGVALLASPFRTNMSAFSDLAIISLITNVLLWYFLSSEKIGWREGAVLLSLYSIFLAISFSGYRF
jgi:cation:H+ antiporter